MQNANNEIERFDAEDAAALDQVANAPAPARRKLRQGERVPIPEIGFPAFLAGEDVEVLDYADGTISAVIPNPATFLDTVGLAIAASDVALEGPHFRFLRRRIRRTTAELAVELGREEEAIRRFESGVAPIPREAALALKLLAVQKLAPPLENSNPKLSAGRLFHNPFESVFEGSGAHLDLAIPA